MLPIWLVVIDVVHTPFCCAFQRIEEPMNTFVVDPQGRKMIKNILLFLKGKVLGTYPIHLAQFFFFSCLMSSTAALERRI